VVTQGISAFFFLLAICIWLVSAAIYIRSKFRADVMAIVLPRGYCFVVACDNGLIDVGAVHPYFSHPLFAWTSGLQYSPKLSKSELAKLRGLNPNWGTQFYGRAGKHDAWTDAANYSWGQFSLGYRSTIRPYWKTDQDVIAGRWRPQGGEPRLYEPSPPGNSVWFLRRLCSSLGIADRVGDPPRSVAADSGSQANPSTQAVNARPPPFGIFVITPEI